MLRRRLIVMCTAALGGVGLLEGTGVSGGGIPAPLRPAAEARAAFRAWPPPGAFALVRTPSGVAPTLELRSAGTGAVLAELGRLGAAWTNNGFAFAPDGRAVYLTLIGNRTLLVQRVDATTGRGTIVADGEQPAVSFDGRALAYASGNFRAEVLAVRDLASGRERRISLARVLGPSFDLLDGSVVWTRDGTRVVVLAPHVAITVALRGRTSSRSARTVPGSCSAHSSGLCLVAITVPRRGRLSARRLALSTSGLRPGVTRLLPDGSLPRAVAVVDAVHFGSALDRIDLARRRPRLAPVVSLPRGLAVALAPDGAELLFLNVGRAPALWRAGIRAGHLVDRRRLVPNVWFAAASW